jgi:hypothetical protein
MRFFVPLSIVLLTLSVSCPAWADLKPWDDYDISDSVWLVTTINVSPNMGDAYLEGLKRSWITQNEIARELGHIEDYKIYRSEPFEGEGFNFLLVVKFKDTSDLAPSKEKYKAFVKKWGRKKYAFKK